MIKILNTIIINNTSIYTYNILETFYNDFKNGIIEKYDNLSSTICNAQSVTSIIVGLTFIFTIISYFVHKYIARKYTDKIERNKQIYINNEKYYKEEIKLLQNRDAILSNLIFLKNQKEELELLKLKSKIKKINPKKIAEFQSIYDNDLANYRVMLNKFKNKYGWNPVSDFHGFNGRQQR